MIVLDASVLVAHLYPFDTHHDHASNLLLDAVGNPLLVHAFTLAEVLVGGVRIGRGVEMRADLTAAGVQLAARDDDEPLRLAELRAATGLKLPDCCVLDAAVVNDARLATFDLVLAKVARRLGVPVVP
jgi:predicted nucleic acid-binding protein